MLKGKRVIVTGGSQGVGLAITKKLVERECLVVICGRNIQKLKTVANELGGNVIPLEWDVSNTDIVKEKINEATDLLGGLDIVVNNAGIFACRNEWQSESLLETTPYEWEIVMKTNASSVFFIMQATVKYMIENNVKGNILNITSAAAEEPVYGAYGASKITSTSLTRGWGKMFAPAGITINGIAPGPVATEMNNWHEGDSLKHDRIPYGRFSTADEIANLAVYMLSDEAKMICGETILFDGAYSVR